MRWICTALVIAAALGGSAGPARAFGNAYLSWNACYHDGGASDITFPCSAGPGNSVSMYATFVPDAPMSDFVALDFVLDTGASTSTMPEFWRFSTVIEPANCNPGIESRTVRPPSGCGSAAEVWNPATTTLVGYINATGGVPSHGRIVGTAFLEAADATAISAGTEYFGFEIRFLTDAATESGGACSGCATPMVIVLQQVQIISRDGPDQSVATDVGSACVTTNGGISCFSVPVRNRTWGQLKQLYR